MCDSERQDLTTGQDNIICMNRSARLYRQEWVCVCVCVVKSSQTNISGSVHRHIHTHRNTQFPDWPIYQTGTSLKIEVDLKELPEPSSLPFTLISLSLCHYFLLLHFFIWPHTSKCDPKWGLQLLTTVVRLPYVTVTPPSYPLAYFSEEKRQKIWQENLLSWAHTAMQRDTHTHCFWGVQPSPFTLWRAGRKQDCGHYGNGGNGKRRDCRETTQH